VKSHFEDVSSCLADNCTMAGKVHTGSMKRRVEDANLPCSEITGSRCNFTTGSRCTETTSSSYNI
jgi:hypothetical protein